MKEIFRKTGLFFIADLLTSPFTFLASLWLKGVRKALAYLPIADSILMHNGILPVPDHYYEPLINPKKHLSVSLRKDRNLPGIDFNTAEQLALLSQFHYNEELLSIPLESAEAMTFYYNNDTFQSGDAEYLYNMVRHFKPSTIIEIGSGNSTLMVRNALQNNKKEEAGYQCRHICIEPYEMPWLERSGVEVIREKVEKVDISLFKSLGKNDILFIDSSHIIRPQGDVLLEYLEILPVINPGVIVHIHDIFSPKDYLDEWVFGHKLWNEQYLLEAFLNFNASFKITGALNYLHHNHREKLAEKCPVLTKQTGREPGSFWMVRK